MRKKWSKEKIVQAIQELRKQNIDLSAGNISKHYIALFSAANARRYFSTWANALKAAGVDYGPIMEAGKKHRLDLLTKWTEEEVLKEIRRSEPEKLLKTYRDQMGLYSAARRIFGNWEKALEAAGYRLTKGSHKNSNQIFRS
jgi:hypothetical protein